MRGSPQSLTQALFVWWLGSSPASPPLTPRSCRPVDLKMDHRIGSCRRDNSHSKTQVETSSKQCLAGPGSVVSRRDDHPGGDGVWSSISKRAPTVDDMIIHSVIWPTCNDKGAARPVLPKSRGVDPPLEGGAALETQRGTRPLPRRRRSQLSIGREHGMCTWLRDGGSLRVVTVGVERKGPWPGKSFVDVRRTERGHGCAGREGRG